MSRLPSTMLLCAALLCALAGGKAAHAARPDSPVSQAVYCIDQGGTVQLRNPVYGTNGGKPLVLNGTVAFCQFSRAHTSISVKLDTLASTKPTLAALAYYAKVKFDGSTCQGSPGSCYCSQLGGTDLFGGINIAGGGWVLTTRKHDVLDTCIFPDLSSIDSYGLFYHSAGIIRGQNLAKVLAYPNPN